MATVKKATIRWVPEHLAVLERTSFCRLFCVRSLLVRVIVHSQGEDNATLSLMDTDQVPRSAVTTGMWLLASRHQ